MIHVGRHYVVRNHLRANEGNRRPGHMDHRSARERAITFMEQ